MTYTCEEVLVSTDEMSDARGCVSIGRQYQGDFKVSVSVRIEKIVKSQRASELITVYDIGNDKQNRKK